MPRSSVYALRSAPGSDRKPGKRGPKTEWSDEALVVEIRTVLSESPFVGEGHRKVRARLAAKGIVAGKNRVLRLMRENGLLTPVRRGRPRGDRSHGGRIRTERPDELWGTDAARFWTRREGWCWFFGVVDHCVTDVVGWHAAKKGDRWAAPEPVRQGVHAQMGGFAKATAAGLGVRHDRGSQYRERAFQAEIKWLGIRSMPAYLGEPECNGVAERFIRTLKEECLVPERLRGAR
ncbi:transposase [Candidatus Palauibacter sp.]|uniref:transposase n=1 Tax=Candidatus Palauibacter sp. TaxID=3101350 RepID=UPI003B5CED2B